MSKVYLHPTVDTGPDPGNGGVHRVILSQMESLAEWGWEVVRNPAAADLIAGHIEIPTQFFTAYGDRPFVYHNHGAYWNPDYIWDADWTYLSNVRLLDALRAADAVTAVSDWTANALRRHSNRDIRVVHNGIDPEDWTPAERPGTYGLWNKTRVDPICDPTPLDQLTELMPDVQFISTFGTARQNVTLTDRLPFDEAKELVRQAGFYLATTRETWGIGTLEAMASGVPVVGWRWGGQAEFIEHGVDGWLARPGDIDGLMQGVRWVMEHRETLGANARTKALRYTTREASRQYAELYDEVLARWKTEHESPRVSVIVPAYNMGDYLADTLRSVEAQDDPDWECIVVNDASPDPRDHEITAEFVARDPRFREIIKPQNQYLAAARNTGIEAARGRFILPLDADDQITPHTVRLLADHLDTRRGVDIAYGNVFFVEEDGRTPHDYHHPSGAGFSGWPTEFRLDWMLTRVGQLLPYSSMFRRRAWELTGGYRSRCRTSEDQDFWLRLSSYGFVPEYAVEVPTLIYRLREGSMSGQQGWENHRAWYPWSREEMGQTMPAAAHRPDARSRSIAIPALDPIVISVIIPVGPGHARWVLDAIDSVDAQGFRNWECIVINDTGEALPNLPQWVRVIQLPGAERFGGVAAARNAGIREARGASFLPLDADDYLMPEALELMLEAQREMAPERVVVYSDFWEDPGGKPQLFLTPDYEARRYISGGMFHAVTALTPISVWEETGGYDPSLPAWEDWAFALQVAATGTCGRRIAAPLFFYRKATGQRSDENFNSFEDSKAAMMAKEFQLTEGNILACQSCPGARSTQTFNPGGSPAAMGAGGPAASSLAQHDGLLVEYIGTRGAAWVMKGNRGPNGEPPREYRVIRQFFILPYDRDRFEALPGEFRIVESGEPSGTTVSRDAPALVAAGPPVQAAPMAAPVVAPPVVPAEEDDYSAAAVEQARVAAGVGTTASARQAPPAVDSFAATPETPVPAAPPAPIPPAPAATPPPAVPPPTAAAAAAVPSEAGEAAELVIPQGDLSKTAMMALHRSVLDAYAGQHGVEGADSLSSKEQVVAGVLALREFATAPTQA